MRSPLTGAPWNTFITITTPPGRSTGEFHYACLIPGHLEAGMIAKITVK